ncbi:DUF4326 domain-containing protein [Streptomyces werraensis]|uniref:DUF4326 domain-containing protein n=1 Tax=Streptomyces werraensis TaxID=68284 RepID=UPI0036FE1C47
MPTRTQRRRTAGWRAPDNTKYVGRGTRYGNPYMVVRTTDGSYAIPAAEQNGKWPTFDYENDARQEAVRLYRQHLADNLDLVGRARRELAGHNLMCWCPEDSPCHADVLLRVAAIPDGAGVCSHCWHWEGNPNVYRACPDCGRPWDHVLPQAAP